MEDISGIENIETLKPLLVYHFDPPLPPPVGEPETKSLGMLVSLRGTNQEFWPAKGVHIQNATILNCQSIFYG